jgi:alkylated DNA repair protein alkB family protein 6
MSSTDAKQDLRAFRLVDLPPEFYYIPNFITAEEEASILQKVQSTCQSMSVESRLGVHCCILPLLAPPFRVI